MKVVNARQECNIRVGERVRRGKDALLDVVEPLAPKYVLTRSLRK